MSGDQTQGTNEQDQIVAMDVSSLRRRRPTNEGSEERQARRVLDCLWGEATNSQPDLTQVSKGALQETVKYLRKLLDREVEHRSPNRNVS